MNDCPFCDVVAKEKDRIIVEKQHLIVVLSNPRLMPEHTLVIPKRHILKPSELSEEERKEFFDTVLEQQEKILKKSSGCDIKQNCRPFLKQSKLKVDHVHFHLMPREFEDELYKKSQIYEKEIFHDLPKN